jgi:hypothetical protein
MAKKKKKTTMDEVAVTTRRYRDSVTGRFVTKKYAKKNRETTVKEAVA